jgi:dihydrofolate reductase
MSLALIAAVAKNNVIGIKNALPWNIPEDLQHFKELTMGKAVLMGQKTYESLLGYLGRALPGRKSIVVSNDPNFKPVEGVEMYRDLHEALVAYSGKELFIIGGASIYKQTIELADTLFVTHVDREVEGDVYFPEIAQSLWQKTSEEKHDGFSFAVYERKSKP